MSLSAEVNHGVGEGERTEAGRAVAGREPLLQLLLGSFGVYKVHNDCQVLFPFIASVLVFFLIAVIKQAAKSYLRDKQLIWRTGSGYSSPLL